MSAQALAAGYAADLAFGDPRRGHPVAGFGSLASHVERVTYAPSRAHGVAYAAGLTVLAAAAAEFAARRLGRGAVLATCTWAALGGRSLVLEAGGIAVRVEAGDIAGARAALPALCGRDPSQLDGPELCRAALESVAENTGDAVVGALLWGAIGGPAGVVGYRAANTLDAMVGHHGERYERFGWGAARLDDALNWPVARVASLLTALCAPVVGGSSRESWRVTRRDGSRHPSPNAGGVEAAFAGALGVRLGGPLSYGGLAELRPHIGDGGAPVPLDVQRAARLSLAVGAACAAACALWRRRRA